MKKAVLIFTKVPKVGEVKTRLTEERGGILTPEEACAFYEACLLDVLDVCLSMKKVDVWICYNKDGERSHLDTLLAQVSYPQRIAGVFPDQGGSFNSCMQYAASFLLKPGKDERLADGLVIVGGDIPTLQPFILQKALDTLQDLSDSKEGQKFATKKSKADDSWIGAAVVEGACQEGGFSLVGLTCTTPFTFQEVFYNMDGITALDMLINKVRAKNIPFGVIEMLPDVDIPVDLASLIPMLRALELAGKNDENIIIPKRTLKFFEETGIQSQTLPPEREAI
ncbi:MAG: DUF2064 domain-containing protein [Peptococcaceae bacterium]|jgi:glycosyltransferase A (GT-A) superfamily protein (DUF2064 family)|nr:DUF2064 domain-containing protein [Peptococcaceae bacterium]